MSNPLSAIHRTIPDTYEWKRLKSDFSQTSPKSPDCELLFVRHGETKYNQRKLVSGSRDTVLTLEGREFAARLRHRLAKQRFSLIFTSDLARARETLRLSVGPGLVRGLLCPPLLDERLREKGLGSFEGKKRQFIAPYSRGDLDYEPVGGESYRDLAQRTYSFILDLWRFPLPIKRVLVITHMGPLRTFRAGFEHTGTSPEMMSFGFSNLEIYRQRLGVFAIPPFLKGGSHGKAETDKNDTRPRIPAE